MGARCGKRFSSATAPINANRELLREDTTVTETVNKDDSISQFGPEKLEKSYCSSNSTSNLAVHETRGCVVIPESKRNENCNDSQHTFETKEIGSLGVVATRCDEPKPRVVGGSKVEITLDLVVPETTGCCMIPESKKNENSNDIPNAFEIEIEIPDDVSTRCVEPLGQTLKDSVPKIPMKRKMNGNNAIEGHYNKRVKTTAVGDSVVEVNYRDGTKMLSGSVNLNSFSTDETFKSSCNSISINSSSTGKLFMNSSVPINSGSTDGRLINSNVRVNSCKNIRINSSSTGGIFINGSNNVCVFQRK